MIYLYWALGIYLVLGVANMFVMLQTPYAYNPKWVMIFLWPIYWIGR